MIKYEWRSTFISISCYGSEELPTLDEQLRGMEDEGWEIFSVQQWNDIGHCYVVCRKPR